MSDSTNESATEAGEKTGWWGRLAGGLKRTSSALGTALADIVTKGPLDPATLDEIEEALIRTDLGLEAAARVTDDHQARPLQAESITGRGEGRHRRRGREGARAGGEAAGRSPAPSRSSSWWSASTARARPRPSASSRRSFAAEGRKVVLAAGDTFRAAAIDQLRIWGQRTGAQVIAREPGADAAGLAFDALTQATARRRRRA